MIAQLRAGRQLDIMLQPTRGLAGPVFRVARNDDRCPRLAAGGQLDRRTVAHCDSRKWFDLFFADGRWLFRVRHSWVTRGVMRANLLRIQRLGKILPGWEIGPKAERPKTAAAAVSGNVQVFVPLDGLIDADEEIRRLEKQINDIGKSVATLEKKLTNPRFIKKTGTASRKSVAGRKNSRKTSLS